MKKRLLSILIALAMCLSLLPVTALAADPAEQFPGLTPGETYWFDLSAADIPGDKNGSLPDDSLHWVPFTYAGTLNAYVLKSRSANDNTAKGDSANAAGSTDPSNPIGYTYDHSLFIADYNVTRNANWATLNGKNLIFGTTYTSGGVDYILRAPSVGSGSTGSEDSVRGTPLNNEWDAILNKANQSYQNNTDGYIKNWNSMDSWGQDTQDGPDPDWNRATRGSLTARSWQFDLKLSPSVGFRPVLELPSSDDLATVTLDLNGGSIGSITGTVNLAVKSDFNLTLPGVTDVTRPNGNDGIYFKWQDSSGNFYEPGTQVPANVSHLTALWEGWTELTKAVLDSNFKVTSFGSDYYRLPSGNYYLGENISVDTKIQIGDGNTNSEATLDLNGYELKNDTNNSPLLYLSCSTIGNTATLTLMDGSSGKTGKVISSLSDAVYLDTNGILNANGGTVNGLVYLNGNGNVINNADLSNVTIFSNGTVENAGGIINGGTFYGKVENNVDGIINGGTFYGTIVNDGTINGGTFYSTVSGGTINDSAKVTVTFDSDNGSTVQEEKVLRGQKVTEPTAPAKADYSFEGWYNGDAKYDFTEAVTENITLTAWWKDIVNPVITGLENAKIYCYEQTVTVSDNIGIASVTVNGTLVPLDANNQFTLKPADVVQEVVATDNAGNKTTVTVTVNNGHTAGNDDDDCSTPVYCIYHPDTVVVAAKSHNFSGKWQSNGNGTHTRYCTIVGCNGHEDGNCAGGKATLTSKAICDYCGEEYGELDSSNLNLVKIPAKTATATETGNNEYAHSLDYRITANTSPMRGGRNIIELKDIVSQKLSPEMIEGTGQSLTAGEKKELTFRSNAAFSDFIRVELDGKTLDEKNYTVTEGSTVVILKADYVAILSAGKHTIGIVSTNGTAATTFTVNMKAAVDNDTKALQTEDNGTTSPQTEGDDTKSPQTKGNDTKSPQIEGTDTKSPQTEDNSMMWLGFVLLLVSGIGIAGVTVYRKRKKAE